MTKRTKISITFFHVTILFLLLMVVLSYRLFWGEPIFYWVLSACILSILVMYSFVYVFVIRPIRSYSKKIKIDDFTPAEADFNGLPCLKDLSDNLTASFYHHLKSEAINVGIVENTMHSIITIDSNGLIVAFNKASEALFGYTPDEVLGQNVSMLMPSPMKENHDHYIHRYLTTKEQRIIGDLRIVEAQKKNGVCFPIELAVSEISVDGQMLFSAIIRDITSTKKQEYKLLRILRLLQLIDSVFLLTEKNKETLVLLMKLAELLVTELDFDCGHVLKTTKKSNSLLETSYNSYFSDSLRAEDFTKIEKIKSIFKDTLISKGLEAAGNAMLQMLPSWIENMADIKTGSTRYTQLYKLGFKSCCAIPFGYDGQVHYVLELFSTEKSPVSTTLIQTFINIQNMVSIHMHQQIMKNDLLSKDSIVDKAYSSRSAFFNRISHDIRTPVNSIIGFSNLLMDTALEGKQQKYVSTIKTSADDLMMLLKDIRDLALLESNSFTLQPIVFNLEEIFTRLKEQFKMKAEEKKLELHFKLQADTPPYITGDAVRLHQVLFNLIENAITYTNYGDVTISYIFFDEPDYYRFQFSVSDTGTGMDEDIVKRYRSLNIKNFKSTLNTIEDEAVKLNIGKGIGLELSILLVQTMGGEVYINSIPSKGTTLTLHIPFEKVKHHASPEK